MDAEGGRFGDYELLQLLGRGGMGEVWRAEDTRRERTVALKLLATPVADRPELRERFRREARLTAVLSSPHVVPIHDWGEVDGRLFLDMRLVEGGSLADLLVEHPDGLPTVWALRLLAQVAEALDAAHARSMVHRDVKPANVLVAGRPEALFCYLTDFGIAKIVEETSTPGLTGSGQVVGTVGYMAPEVLSGGTATSAADVYALGCLFHAALTGRPAIAATSVPAAVHAHVYGPVPELAPVRPDLARLDPVLARALAKSPEDRFATAGEFAAAAASAWAGPGGTVASSAAPTTEVATAPHPVHRRPWFVLIAVLLLVALGGGVLVARTMHRNAPVTAGARVPAPASTAPAGTVRTLPVAVSSGESALVAPDGASVYLTATDEPTIRRVDLTTGAVLATFPLSGIGPDLMALSGNGSTLAVKLDGDPDQQGAGVALVDLATGITSFVGLPTLPGDLVFSPDGGSLFVSLRGSDDAVGNAVAVVDVAQRRVVRTVPVAAEPVGLAVSADRTTVAVACAGLRDDPGGTVDLIPVAGGPDVPVPTPRPPFFLAALADGRFAVSTTTEGPGTVDLVDPQTRAVTTIADPALIAPVRLVLTPDGRRLLVTQRNTESSPPISEVDLLDVASGRDILRVPVPAATDAVPTPDGRRAVVVSESSVSVVELPT